MAMKLAIPDLISNSYFPALAAAELGFFVAEGLAVSVELINPVDRAYQALRDGEVDFVGGAAHAVAHKSSRVLEESDYLDNRRSKD
jgi:NitT/TauT family transport system substrate-binding protein